MGRVRYNGLTGRKRATLGGDRTEPKTERRSAKMNMHVRWSWSVVVVLLCLGLLCTAVPFTSFVRAASTWYVDPTGTDDSSHGGAPGLGAFKTIAYAVNQAGSGDTIQVAAGTYDEQVVINKSLDITGAGDTTVIQPDQTTIGGFTLFDRYSGSGNIEAAIIVVTNVSGTNQSVILKTLRWMPRWPRLCQPGQICWMIFSTGIPTAL